MAVRELRVPANAVLAALLNEELIEQLNLPADAQVSDVALDHGHDGAHRGQPPVIVLQISSDSFDPKDVDRPLLPISL